MKKQTKSGVAITVAIVAGIASVAALSISKARSSGEAGKLQKQFDLMKAIDNPQKKSASDAEIAKWEIKVKANSSDDTSWVYLGDALMQKARETADAGYYSLAEEAYNKALKIKPQSSPGMTGMAWVNGGRHEFEKSIDWSQKAIAIDPKNNLAYGLIGDAQVEMGDYDGAYSSYQKMLDIRPDISSYSRGAHLLNITGDTMKATLLMTKAIQMGGPYAENTSWCRAQLALILFNEGALMPAEKMLDQAMKNSPNNYQVLAAMGKVKAAKKDYTGAIECYQRSATIAPQHDTIVSLGDLYELTGKSDEANRQYALLETIHTLNKSKGVRGDMLMALFYADHDRNLDIALREAQEEYSTRKNVYAQDTLAWCLYKNGKFEDAKDMIKRALSHRTPDARITFHAALIYEKLGDHQSAQQFLYRALSLNPNFSPIYASVAASEFQKLGSEKKGTTRTAGLTTGR